MVVSIIFSDFRECSLNSLSCTQSCMSKCFNIRVNAISVCQYLQLKIFINSASSSLALKSCQEIIIINLQRILSIASLLSATNFCRSELGLHPLLQKQFCRNVNNRQRIKMLSRSNFRKRKSKEL